MTQATGGAVSYYIRNNVAYKVHTFTTSGTLTVTETGNIDILAVAGGGAGHGYVGGGGGAGGLLYQTNLAITSNLTVTIGAGATGIQTPATQDYANSASGGNTTVTGTGVSLTAVGGGGAGGYSDMSGTAGGSGGGCGGEQGGGATGGAGTAGQGNRGGNSVSGRSGNPSMGAGGGGAGAVGGNSLGAGNTTAGSGGAGKQEGVDFFIDGTGLWYAGGGGGGMYNGGAGAGAATAGNGGAGGGGGGGAFGTVSTPGTGGIGRNSGGIGQGSDTAGRGGDGGANTGGGGGGVGHYSSGTNGRAGSGGSGIVIVRYSFTPAGLTAVQNSATLTLNKFATNTSTAPVTGSGGSNVYSYSISPALPSGLSINASTGAITGQPQTAVTGVTYTVTVNDGFTSTTNTFSLTTTTNLSTTIEAAGGSIGYYFNSTRNTIYKTHTFTSAGNLVVTTPGTITISAWGGGGGGGWTSGSGAGGGGAFVQGEFAASITSYGIVVGGAGLSRANDAGTGTAPTGGGGLPGNSGYGGQGGGYSGFFATTTISQAGALLIAGGGGGGSWEGRAGGAAGITEGSPGQDGTTYGGRGGSQIAGGYSASGAGSALQGGNIGAQGDGGGGGGGGGGYFGGGGGTSDGTGSGGGGGSSYFAGNITSTVAAAGSGSTAGGTSSALYRSWGTGGASGANNGNPGAVIVSYPFDPSPLITTVATPSVTLNRWNNNGGVTPITVTGGLAPYFYTVSPSLPAGLHFNTATGQITGQPTVATGPTVYSVTVRDSTITLIGAPVNSAVNTFTLTTTITLPGAMTVSGGSTSTTSANGLNYQVHTFTSSGNLTLGQTTTLEYLVVAGGGGGGGRHGGGGGGGGLVTSTVSLPAGTYPIIVGAGGSGAQTDTQGNDGFDSGIIQSLQHGSGEFDGRTSFIQLANSTALTLNTGSWTIECWLMPTGDYSQTRTVFGKRVSGSASTAYFGYLHTPSGVVAYYNGTTEFLSSTVLTPRTWSHVAWVYNGTNIRIFVNGVSILNSATAVGEVNEPLVIGHARGYTASFHGYISNFRIVKGTALYTADFTPPTAPLTAISGTSLLTLQHPTQWVDSSTNAATITTSGTPVQSPFNPFNNLDASGGGGGGSYSSNTNTPGRVGGSGGGGGTLGAAGGAAWVGQGNSGGQGNGDEGGGGGGAATPGQTGISGSYAGAGGAGAISNIDGLNYYYAGGGGGGSWQSQPGAGGLGGGGGGGGGETNAFGAGGTGGRTLGSAGIGGFSGNVNGGAGGANTGGGGGSSGQRDYQSYTGVGGNGGSGIVIIRYITGAGPLSTTKVIPKVLIGKYDNAPQTPVTPIGGTTPYTYSISPSLPEGLLFSSGNGAIYGTPSVATYDTTYTVSITDSSATPITATNTFVLSTSVSYQYAIDLVANRLLKVTTEYGISDADRRSAYIESPGAQIVTNNLQSNNKTLLHGNVLSISSQANLTYGLGTDVITTVTVPSTFNNYVNVGGNLKTYYGNIVANVSNFFLSNAFYGTAGTYTWTVPAGVTSISVAGVGGGGGGSQKASGGSGGSGGQLKYVNNIAVTPGDTYTIVVGLGGNTGGTYGATGGDTYMFKTGNTVPILLAAGGRGGDSMYWNDTTTSVTVYDTPTSATFYTFSATSPANETISYTVTAGSLPNGVTLNSSTGVLGGDPDTVTQSTNYTFTVSAITASQTISRQFTLKVDPLPDVIVTFSPSLNGLTSWNFTTQGNLAVFYSNVSYTMTPQAPTEFDVKLWGGGGGGTTDGGIGGGGGYAAGRFSAALGVGYRLSVGQGGGGVVGNRNAGGGAAATGIEFAGNSTPIIVAGGGGGGAQSGAGRAGGAGGGTDGATGAGSGGAGGTQSAAGAGGNGGRRTGASGSGRNGGFGSTGSQSSRFAYGFGVGGWGSVNGGDAGSGGGGAGYFGGGEGGGDAGGFGGGGGSGYTHPTLVTNAVLTAGSAQTPGNNSDTQRSLLLGTTEFGGNAGLGGTGGVIGSDGVNSSGFNGLIIISNSKSLNSIGSLNNPAPSIAAIRAAGITTDGPYWFSTAKQATPFQAFVRFNYIDGGDWALLLKVHSQGDMPSGSTYWTNTALYNPVDWNLTSGTWSKYATWNGIPFTRLMMVMTQGGVAKVPPIMIFNTSRTFAEAITLAGGATAASGQNNTVKADSTDPPRGNNVAYHNVSMKSGTAFTDVGGSEDQMQGYGIGMWANNASNSTTAETFASTGRAGAWIGCPLDDQGHTFNNNHNTGADSGFGFGFAAGNGAKTGSAGYAEWTNGSSTNTLPGYVWVR